MPANTQVSSDIDTLLRLPSKVAVQDYLGVDDNTAGVAANAAAILLKAPILDATFTGTTTIPSADITTADFNAGAAGNGGELSWNNTEKTLDLVTGSDSVTVQVGQEIVMYCKNTQGRPLLNGEVVKVVSATGNIPTIQTVSAGQASEAHKAMGVCTQDFDTNGFGFITTLGKVRNLNFPSSGQNPEFSVGQVVYLSDTVSGGLTTVKPEIEVEIGQVLRTGTTQGTLGVRINNEASIYELQQTVPHNTGSAIFCNEGDQINDKFNEALALTPNGLPVSRLNRATLYVMAGTYGDLFLTNEGVNVIGIGSPECVVLGDIYMSSSQGFGFYADVENLSADTIYLADSRVNFKNIKCVSLARNTNVTFGAANSGTITDSHLGGISLDGNSGTMRNITGCFNVSLDTNYGVIDGMEVSNNLNIQQSNGTIKNVVAESLNALRFCDNYGTIENVTGGNNAFGAFPAAINYGTYKNCSGGNESFGQQDVDGVTEDCTAGNFGFAARSSIISWGVNGIKGTYKNCVAGINSFFGSNTNTAGARTIEANYISCTAKEQSFGHVNNVGSETIFGGTATNCTAGFRSFASVGTTGGAASISADAIIENCSAGNFSFGSEANSDNFGKVLRCRTTQLSNPFKASGTTGVVRLSLDGNYNVVNIPAIP